MDTPPSTPWGYIQVAARSLQHAANQTFQFGRRTLFLSPTSDADDDASAQHDASPVRHEPEEVEYDSDGDAAFLERECCKEACHNSISSRVLLERRLRFNMLSSRDKQLLCYTELSALASPPDPSGLRTLECKIQGRKVCFERYRLCSKLGTRSWGHVSSLVRNGETFSVLQTSQRRRSSVATHKDSFNADMQALCNQFGECMPNQVAYYPPDRHRKRQKLSRPLVFLHCGIFADMEDVFRDMKHRRIVPSDTPSRTMRRWWKENWWHVKIKSWQPFAKCDDCVKFRARILVAATEPLKDAIRIQQGLHRSRISIGRLRYDLREKLSKTYPDLFLHASIDGMDNKKTNIPQTRYLSHTKKNAGGELLKSRVMGKKYAKFKFVK